MQSQLPHEASSMQWRSQDIAFARAQHGHTTFVRTSTRSAEAYRGVWGHPPPKNLGILQPLRSVQVTYGNLTYDERMRLVIRCYA